MEKIFSLEDFNKLIKEQVEQSTIQNNQPVQTQPEKSQDQQDKFSNLGNSIEFFVTIALAKAFLENYRVQTYTEPREDILLKKGIKLAGGSEKMNTKKPDKTNVEVLQDEASAFAESYVNSSYVKKNFLDLKGKNKLSFIKIKHIGNLQQGISSGDVEIRYVYTYPTPAAIHRISLKRGNNVIYQTSSFKSIKLSKDATEDQYKSALQKRLPKSEKKLDKLVKQLGGGPRKIFNMFGYAGEPDAEKQIRNIALVQKDLIKKAYNILQKNINNISSQEILNLTNDFSSQKNKKQTIITNYFSNFSNFMKNKYNQNPQDIKELFNIIQKLSSRSDETVYSIVDLENFDTEKFGKQVFFPELIDQYLEHIKNVKVVLGTTSKYPSIDFIVGDIEEYEPVKKDLAINKRIEKEFSAIAFAIKELQKKKDIKDKKSTKAVEKLLELFNLQEINFADKREIFNFLKTLQKQANNYLKPLKNKDIFILRYLFKQKTLVEYLGVEKSQIPKTLLPKTNDVESSSEDEEDDIEYGSFNPDEEAKKQEGSEGDHTIFKKTAGFKVFSELLNGLYELENSDIGPIKEILKSLNNVYAELKTKKTKRKPKNLNEFIIYEYNKNLFLNENKKQILNKIKNKINSLSKSELGIISVTPSNKSEAALVVRCEDKENIDSVRSKVKSAIEDIGFSAHNRVIAKFEPSTESTEVPMNDDSGGIYIVYKYDTGSREGLALEHIMGLLLTKKITSELKNRLDLPPEASKEEVKQKLKNEYQDILETALQGKKLVNEKIGEVIEARSEGSRNSKADLILTTADGHTYGLSIKLVTEEGREVRFTYNKNLGYGNDEEDTLVKSPNGRPWWLIGRQNFAKKLGRQFKGNPEDLEPPGWMTKAKESKSDIYKEAMEETYASLREVFVDNLKKLKLKQLVDMVNEAHNGGEQEEEYEKLFVLTSDADGIRLESKGHEEPDIEKIKMSGIKKSDIVKTDGARIIIDIPGMSPLTIHGLKFHSNMLSSNREDLKIKTR